jgi:hypothetical protein
MNTEHSQPPPLPPDNPTVPAAPLWTSLLVPPLVMAAGGLLIGLSSERQIKESLFLFMPLLVVALIFGLSFVFSPALGRRYRGTSLVLLVFAYVIGQVIICLALWFGSCLLVL